MVLQLEDGGVEGVNRGLESLDFVDETSNDFSLHIKILMQVIDKYLKKACEKL